MLRTCFNYRHIFVIDILHNIFFSHCEFVNYIYVFLKHPGNILYIFSRITSRTFKISFSSFSDNLYKQYMIYQRFFFNVNTFCDEQTDRRFLSWKWYLCWEKCRTGIQNNKNTYINILSLWNIIYAKSLL